MARFAALALPAVAFILATAVFVFADPDPAPRDSEMTQEQQTNYTLGYVICRQLQKRQIPIDTKAFADGFRAALNKQTPALTGDQMRAALEAIVDHQHDRSAVVRQPAPAVQEEAPAPPSTPIRRVIVDDPYTQVDPNGFNLRIDTQLDTAVPATRRNTLEGDNPNLIR